MNDDERTREFPKRLRMKGIFLSEDGGKTWVLSRQYYVAAMDGTLLQIYFQGKVMQVIGESQGREPWKK